MTTPLRYARDFALAVAMAAAAANALATERGTTPDGAPYAAGGVGLGERQALHDERRQYNLWVTTVAEPTGAYLASAHVRVIAVPGERIVFDKDIDGPWLMIALPKGDYRIEATVHPEGAAPLRSQRKAVSVRPGLLRQVVFRFKLPVDVGPDRPQSLGGNPFSSIAPGRRPA